MSKGKPKKDKTRNGEVEKETTETNHQPIPSLEDCSAIDERPPLPVFTLDMPKEGFDSIVSRVLAYLDEEDNQLSRAAVDFVTSNGYAPYTYWPKELLDDFVKLVAEGARDESLIRSTAVFHATTSFDGSVVTIARSAMRVAAMKVWAEVLEKHIAGREVKVTGG